MFNKLSTHDTTYAWVYLSLKSDHKFSLMKWNQSSCRVLVSQRHLLPLSSYEIWLFDEDSQYNKGAKRRTIPFNYKGGRRKRTSDLMINSKVSLFWKNGSSSFDINMLIRNYLCFRMKLYNFNHDMVWRMLHRDQYTTAHFSSFMLTPDYLLYFRCRTRRFPCLFYVGREEEQIGINHHIMFHTLTFCNVASPALFPK